MDTLLLATTVIFSTLLGVLLGGLTVHALLLLTAHLVRARRAGS